MEQRGHMNQRSRSGTPRGLGLIVMALLLVLPTDALQSTSTLMRSSLMGLVSAHKQRSPRRTVAFVHRASKNDSDLPPSSSEVRPTSPGKGLFRELCAEAIGTGLIVFLGTASVLSAVVAGELVGLGQIAATWAVAVTLAIATTGPISGAHLNPAMTLSFSLLRGFPRTKVLPYILAQMLGAGAASGINYVLYASRITAFETARGIVRSSLSDTAIQTAKCFGEYFLGPVTILQAFLAEALGTAVLAFCVFGLTHPRNDTTINKVYIPPLIGITVGGLICALAPLTQAGFNPARDFAPRMIAYAAGWTGVAFRHCWLYLLAPMIGAPIGSWVAETLLAGSSVSEKS